MNVAGNWANTGTFTPGTSNTVVLNGNNNTQALTGTTSFNNLTSNHTGTGGVTASGSSLTVTGLFRIQGGTFTSSSSYNNVQIDSGATLAGINATTIGVTGNWTNNGGTFTPNGNTVSFNGGAAQVIGGSSTTQSFGNFTVNKSGNALTTTATTIGVNDLTMTAGNFTAPATLNVGGNVVLTAGNFTVGANTNVGGNWTNNGGTFTPGANTVTLNGAALQTIGGSGANTFGSLAVNNAAGVTLSGNVTVNNLLTMTNGNINAGVNTLIMAATTGSVNHTAGVVLGKVQKNIAAGARSPESPQAVFTYPVGTATGYSPVTANFTAGSNGSLTVAAFDGTMPAVPAISDATALDRYWQMTKVSTVTADLTLQYLAADVDGTEANYRLIRGSGGVAIALANGCPTSPCVNAATHTITANGVTQFDNFWTAGEPLAPTAANVEVAGRVLTADGRGVFGARVQMTDSSGNIRTALTSSLGYYRFDNVPSGQDYVIQVAHKRYVFAPRLVSVSDSLGDVDFIAEP
jgi:MSHA biogenesis protein MshQ